jgi:hypothetical protein
MTFEQFRCFIINTFAIVSADLNELEDIADKANNTSPSVRPQPTRRPQDITECDELDIDISRCTIPIAMVCFSIIDMVGQWINKEENDDFGLAAGNFFTTLVNRDDLKKGETIIKFKEQFRHGIMHSFFARTGYGVSYPEFEGNSLFLDLDGKGSTLNVRYLVQALRTGMEELQTMLDNKDSELSKKIYDGFKRWISKA